MTRLKLRLLWLCLAACWLSPAAWAHQQGSSYSQWQLQTQPSVQLRISELDLTRVSLHPQYTQQYDSNVLSYLQDKLRLFSNDSHCLAEAGQLRVAEPGWLAASWAFNCDEVEALSSWRIESDILLAQAPGHLHFARLIETYQPIDRLLTSRSKQWLIDPAAEISINSGFASYLTLGVIHIWEGWDHLAFVLALLLLASSWRQLAWLITGFTVGHSVTLALATLGWLQPNIVLIEAVIAWSIALLAVELLWQKTGRSPRWWLIPLMLLAVAMLGGFAYGWLLLGLALFTAGYGLAIAHNAPNENQQENQQENIRTLVTVAFGLIHGCGFAAVLAELSLPSQQIFSSLLGFNLGVELGQLAIVLPAWPLLRAIGQRYQVMAPILGVLLVALASYWWYLRVM